ncbi:MAG: serine protease [Candidatus Micrarchaeota archaeon]
MGSSMEQVRAFQQTLARPAGGFRTKRGMVESILSLPSCSGEDRTEKLIERLCQSSISIDTKKSGGSGVIVFADGSDALVLTARHVIEAALRSEKSKSLKLRNDGRSAKARRLLVAPHGIDVALVEARGNIGPPAPIGTEKPRLGAKVIVIGAGMGIDNSVSMGIVSKVFMEKARKFGYDIIQTDAVINPGNSGGGIFKAATGELVGVTCYKLVVGGKRLAEGGFAISVNLMLKAPLEGWRVVELA